MRLVLDLPTSNKLEEILSEGEQRAIALGSFLAELKLANHAGGIVFDDPVSSLDRKRCGNVAKRLASEALQRQVVVFTHDVVFLHELLAACKKLNSPAFACFVEACGGRPGVVSQGLPWDHKSYDERIDAIEKAQKRFEKMPWPSDPPSGLSLEMRHQYDFLRATIERVVEDLVLNGTVKRFDNYIRVSNLDRVVGLEKSEVDGILCLYQRCHDLVVAHDTASARDAAPPTPDELKNDIEALKKVIEAIRTRRKSTSGATT